MQFNLIIKIGFPVKVLSDSFLLPSTADPCSPDHCQNPEKILAEFTCLVKRRTKNPYCSKIYKEGVITILDAI